MVSYYELVDGKLLELRVCKGEHVFSESRVLIGIFAKRWKHVGTRTAKKKSIGGRGFR